MTTDKAIEAAARAIADFECRYQYPCEPDCTCTQQARAALAAAEAEAWRPIEEAPRGGTRVLVLMRDGHAVTASWDDDYHGWISSIGGPLQYVTHWSPLPAPPTQKGPPGGVAD